MKLKVYYTEKYYDKAYWDKEYDWEKVYDELVMDSDGDFYFICYGDHSDYCRDDWIEVYEQFRVEVIDDQTQ